tara:strand:- start:716 stop:2797 length:2082 start_codon:yes stop_codon:yes gene_type:complete
MLGTTFNYNAIRSYVVAFGTLFNDIKIQRMNNAGAVAQILNVPLSYAPKERWLARLNRDPDITEPTAISLPRMSYEMVSVAYAPERKLNTMTRTVVSANTTFASSMFMPVPYDMVFSLYVYVKNSADGAAVVEQILPFFTPEFTLTLNNFTDFNINVDVPMILNNVNKEDVYDGSYEDRRVTVWSLDFTVKGLLYGPVQHKGIIKRAFVDFFVPSSTKFLTGNAVSLNSVPSGTVKNYMPLGLAYFNRPNTEYVITTGAGTSGLTDGSTTYPSYYLSGLKDSTEATNSEAQEIALELSTANAKFGTTSLKITGDSGSTAPNNLVKYFATANLTLDNSQEPFAPHPNAANFTAYGIPIPAGKKWLFSYYIMDATTPTAADPGNESTSGANFVTHAYHATSPSYSSVGDIAYTSIPSQSSDNPTLGDKDSEGWRRAMMLIDLSSTTSDSLIFKLGGVVDNTEPNDNDVFFIDGMLLEDVSDEDWATSAAASAGGGPSAMPPISNRIHLASDASRLDDYYNQATIKLSDGLGSGNTNIIVDYDGFSQTANLRYSFPEHTEANTQYEITYVDPNYDGSIPSTGDKGLPTVSRIYIEPGLSATGEPVSNTVAIDQAHANVLSVSVDSIDANDDFGYITTQTFYPTAGEMKAAGGYHRDKRTYLHGRPEGASIQQLRDGEAKPGDRRNLKTGLDEGIDE